MRKLAIIIIVAIRLLMSCCCCFFSPQDMSKCRGDGGGAEDLEMGRCLQALGVVAGDTRDELGRERFHPFVPEHHLIPGILPADMWYWSYNYYDAKQVGFSCFLACFKKKLSFFLSIFPFIIIWVSTGPWGKITHAMPAG